MAPKTDLQAKVASEPIDPIELNAWKRGFTPQAEIWNGRSRHARTIHRHGNTLNCPDV